MKCRRPATELMGGTDKKPVNMDETNKKATNLCWKLLDPAHFFVLCALTKLELHNYNVHNYNVSIG